MKNQAK